MAKTRSGRSKRPHVEQSRPIRAHDPALETSVALTKLLANSGDSRGVLTHSGLVPRAGRLRASPIGWGGWAFDIPVPPPGKVLWFYFAFDWQLFTWDSWGPSNNSSSQMRVDFGVTWHWQLTTHPIFPEPRPVFMSDLGRYEFYSSVAPGGSGFDAAWIAPARSVTLSPDSKETDPNAINQLYKAKYEGALKLWYAYHWTDFLVNGKVPHGFTYDGGPDTLYYAWAIIPSWIDVPTVDDSNILD